MAGGFGDELMLRLSPETTQQPDLTLRLSLGETYGAKSNQNSLTRSSSVIGVISQNDPMWKRDMQSRPSSFLSLARSCSLPAEPDQLERIKLKELQLIRRLEAKKRLLEQRSGRAAAVVVEEKSLETAATPPSPSEVAAWAAASAAKSPALCRAIDKIKSLQGSFSRSYRLEGHGSVGSAKGSSSSQSSLELNDIEQVVTSQIMASRKGDEAVTHAAKRARVSKELMEGNGVVDMMKTMPNVSTIGDGPNGRKVEGLLYKYKKGEVCIVCVCHGSFLTPAEFVKHAGGREVANPMKHIHVYCTSFSLGNERKHQVQ